MFEKHPAKEQVLNWLEETYRNHGVFRNRHERRDAIIEQFRDVLPNGVVGDKTSRAWHREVSQRLARAGVPVSQANASGDYVTQGYPAPRLARRSEAEEAKKVLTRLLHIAERAEAYAAQPDATVQQQMAAQTWRVGISGIETLVKQIVLADKVAGEAERAQARAETKQLALATAVDTE